jgi:hypothetical protein
VSETTTKEIVNWLRKLGMAEYAQRFAENDLDISVLPHLSDQDLKELASRLAIGARCWQRLPSSTARPLPKRLFLRRHQSSPLMAQSEQAYEAGNLDAPIYGLV